MDAASQLTAAHAEAVQNRIDFLRIELATGFTLISIAETERNIGNREHAARTLLDAEKAFATIQRFLGDPKHSMHLSEEEQQEFTDGVSQLRKKLDDITR